MKMRELINLIENTLGRHFIYIGNCTYTHHGPYLEAMMDAAVQVKYRELHQAVGQETLREVFPDFYWGARPDRKRGQLALRQDPYVSFYKSTFRGFACYFVQESAIEFIFVDSAYDDVDWKVEERRSRATKFYVEADGKILSKLSRASRPLVSIALADGIMTVVQSSAFTQPAAETVMKLIRQHNPTMIDDDGEETSVADYEAFLRQYL